MPKNKSEKTPVKVEILDPEIIEDKQEEEIDEGDDIVEASLVSEESAPEKEGSLLPVSLGEGLPEPAVSDPLKLYIREISRYKLLDPEEEKRLTRELVETGDIEVAKKLVQANLRLVVKIAMDYRGAYQNVMDLIQEGNIGLMKAVSKYDPTKGAKLSYYASWWIKSYILKFILDNFRMVKIGTTSDQKKLFFNLMREKEKLIQMGIKPEPKLISERLGVSEKAVVEMNTRLDSGAEEVSLDRPVGIDGQGIRVSDRLADPGESVEDQLSHLQDLEILKEQLGDFVKDLKPRDQEIFRDRLLREVPFTLNDIAQRYGVSRERIRQIEERLLKKLRVYMGEFLK